MQLYWTYMDLARWKLTLCVADDYNGNDVADDDDDIDVNDDYDGYKRPKRTLK